MDNLLLNRKLTSLNRCLDRIKEKTPQSSSDLEQDLDLQDIIGVNLERAVQITVDIASHIIASNRLDSPNTMTGVFTVLSKAGVLDPSLANILSRAVGFRNIAVHEYDQLDWNRVYSLITNDLSVFKSFGKVILGLMEQH
jgi:uncharacterized protein YutE (UPF0331/DUF86 family)